MGLEKGGLARECKRSAARGLATRGSAVARRCGSAKLKSCGEPPPPFDSHEATARARCKCWRAASPVPAEARDACAQARGETRQRTWSVTISSDGESRWMLATEAVVHSRHLRKFCSVTGRPADAPGSSEPCRLIKTGLLCIVVVSIASRWPSSAKRPSSDTTTRQVSLFSPSARPSPARLLLWSSSLAQVNSGRGDSGWEPPEIQQKRPCMVAGPVRG